MKVTLLEISYLPFFINMLMIIRITLISIFFILAQGFIYQAKAMTFGEYLFGGGTQEQKSHQDEQDRYLETQEEYVTPKDPSQAAFSVSGEDIREQESSPTAPPIYMPNTVSNPYRYSYIGSSIVGVVTNFTSLKSDINYQVFDEFLQVNKTHNKTSLFTKPHLGLDVHFGFRLNRYFGQEFGFYYTVSSKNLQEINRQPFLETWKGFDSNGSIVNVKEVKKQISSIHSMYGGNLDLFFFMPIYYFEPFILAGVSSNMMTALLKSKTTLLDIYGIEHNSPHKQTQATAHGIGGRLGGGFQIVWDRGALRMQYIWQKMYMKDYTHIKYTSINSIKIDTSNHFYLTYNYIF